MGDTPRTDAVADYWPPCEGTSMATLCRKLERENAALRKARRSDLDLAISMMSQIYGAIEEGNLDAAGDACRGAADMWAQDIAVLDAAMEKATLQAKP
jgi:hypothetical protein